MFNKIKFSDETLVALINNLVFESMKQNNLTRVDALFFVKGLLIKRMPFIRKQSVINIIDSLMVSK